MPEQGTVTVRMFGALHALQRERGRPWLVTVEVPDDGISGEALAEALELPCEMIEGVFINRVVQGLDEIVHPGDRVAFVPYGTPGPHRVYLGLHRAGSQRHDATGDLGGGSTRGGGTDTNADSDPCSDPKT